MAEPFIGQLMMVGYNFAQRNWASCDGQLILISQNQALFALLGTTFGGDGRTNFALPDLRARTPVGQGTANIPGSGTVSYPIGTKAGVPEVTLSTAQMPAHTHGFVATTSVGDSRTNNDSVPAQLATGDKNLYIPSGTPRQLAADSVSSQGGGQSHPNMQPSLGILFVIAMQGLFPSRN